MIPKRGNRFSEKIMLQQNLCDLEILRRGLAPVADELVLHDLTFVERAQTGTLHGRDMDEYVLVSSRRPDEPIALGRVEPFDGAFLHGRSPSVSMSTMTRCASLRAAPQAGSWVVPKRARP